MHAQLRAQSVRVLWKVVEQFQVVGARPSSVTAHVGSVTAAGSQRPSLTAKLAALTPVRSRATGIAHFRGLRLNWGLA